MRAMAGKTLAAFEERKGKICGEEIMMSFG